MRQVAAAEREQLLAKQGQQPHAHKQRERVIAGQMQVWADNHNDNNDDDNNTNNNNNSVLFIYLSIYIYINAYE